MKAKQNANYEVGYSKPPKHTRFQPGQSGNSKGRPKGTRNLSSDLKDELGERIRIREGDQEKSISKQRALVKALVAKALKGDTRAATVLIAMVDRYIILIPRPPTLARYPGLKNRSWMTSCASMEQIKQ